MVPETDRRTDVELDRKSDMKVGAPPKNFQNFQNEINYYNKHIPEANRLMKKLTREVFNLYFIYKTS